MKRAEAIQRIAPHLTGNRVVVSCNGMMSREVFAIRDRPEHFYMIGSMGLASSIGLGIALRRPEKTIVVLDGDGNLLMNLGTLGNIAALAPRNFYHIVLDNGVHDSTGGQATVSQQVPLERVAQAAGYARALRIADASFLDAALSDLWTEAGPAMLVIQVEPGNVPGIGRMEIQPDALAERFRGALGTGVR